MKLIRIEAVGFKSFANRIILNFDGKIVGIVGPNGSGKSNINDAIRWVLGEQSKKNLRSSSMQDVIFSGAKGHKGSSFAEVSLTFDNRDKKADIPHRKIVITRRIERGTGSNSYFINGEPARLRDLTSIAMASGVGKSSLAIISQGTVAQIAESSAEERRFIFEEAAGISYYRVRKREAISKLEKTLDNLSKLELVTAELANQVKPLKRQSKKATEFVSVKDRLEEIEVSLLAHDINDYSQKLNLLNKNLSSVITEKDALSSRAEKIQVQISAKLDAKYRLDQDIQDIDAKHSVIADQLLQLQVRQAKMSERRKLLVEKDSKMSQNVIDSLKVELQELDTNLKVINQWAKDLKNEVRAKETDAYNLNTDISKAQLDRSVISEKLFRLKSQRDILVDYEKNRTNLFKGTKTILNNREAFKGVHDIVANLIKPEKEYETAISTILKNALQHIVVDSPDHAIKAVNFLKKNQAGSATFIPLEVIKSRILSPEILEKAFEINGFIGEAYTLVDVNDKYAILNEFLLGGILVVDKIETAKLLAETFDYRYLVVSIEGDIIRPGGTITGGMVAKEQGLLNLNSKIAQIDEVLPEVEKQIKEFDEEINEKENKLREEQTFLIELRNKISQNEDKEQVIRTQFDELRTKFESLSREKLDLESSDDLPEQIQKLKVSKSNLKTALEVKRKEIIKYNDEIQTLNTLKIEVETKLFKISESSSESLNEKNKLDFYINKAKNRLAEQYEITYEKIANSYNKNIDAERARKEVYTLRQSMKKLGNVNLQAIQDFENINKRYEEKMTSQNELQGACNKLEESISKMDEIMTTKFDESVRAIEVHFKKVFIEMFGGGFARLVYTKPDNLLESGVEIVAQPPGKNVRNLRLFSGGEKSLMAISLLFAILEYKPLPLCILDEAEASLDELNIYKFSTYLQKLKATTQFLIITHRVSTMEKLDLLVGVTMQVPGITSIFSVQMHQAKSLIEKMQKSN